MAGRPHPAERLPEGATLDEARTKAARCRACDLWRRATQTVFGAGDPRAKIVLVGEQPGDQEDRAGKPFVGPAGRVLEEALAAAGVDVAHVYLTNAVKHFKWKPTERGKRRLHQKPNALEIAACRPWLLGEIAALRPRVIVCLGATAAQSLLGSGFRVTKQRGAPIPFSSGAHVIATVHPASILRAPDHQTRQLEMDRFVADLGAARALLSRR